MFFVQAEDAFHELEQIEKDTLALRVRQRRAVRVESRLVSGIVLYSLLGFLLTFCGVLVLLYTLLPEWHWALRLALCAPLVLFFPLWCAQHLAFASPFMDCCSAAVAHSCSGFLVCHAVFGSLYGSCASCSGVASSPSTVVSPNSRSDAPKLCVFS